MKAAAQVGKVVLLNKWCTECTLSQAILVAAAGGSRVHMIGKVEFSMFVPHFTQRKQYEMRNEH